MQWRLHLVMAGCVPIGKAVFCYGPLDRHIPAAQVTPREWMPPHEQQVEDQHGQTKAVVVRRPHQPTVASVLQFWRRKKRNSYIARISVAVGLDLERIAID
jgi:hypothetical protein